MLNATIATCTSAKIITFPPVLQEPRRQSIWPCITIDFCAFRHQHLQQKRRAENIVMGEMYRKIIELEEERTETKRKLDSMLRRVSK